MTTPEPATDPVWAFVHALPPRVKAQLNRTERLVALVHRATRDQGWAPQQLAAECSRDHNNAINGAAIVMHRLEHAAENPPASQTGLRRVHFGCCEGGWLYDDDTGDATKCPGNRPAEVTS